MEDCLEKMEENEKGEEDDKERARLIDDVVRILTTVEDTNGIRDVLDGLKSRVIVNKNDNILPHPHSISNDKKSTIPPAPPPPPPPPPRPPIPSGGVLKATTSVFPSVPPPPPPIVQLKSEAKQREIELPEGMKPKKTPSGGRKLRSLQWSKIGAIKVTTTVESNIWMRASCSNKEISLDYSQLDNLFCVSEQSSTSERKSSTASTSKKETVDLLCPKRSLQANIFLKQIKDPDSLVEEIREGGGELSKETLSALQPLLPDKEEVIVLRGYTGDVSLLAPAERFFLSLIQVPDYSLKLNCLLYRRQFHSTVDEILPLLKILQSGVHELLSSRALGRLLLAIVRIGNYLNHGNAHGNAAGFKLNSLWKVGDVRSVRTNEASAHNLLHYIAQLNPCGVDEVEREMPSLSTAAKISVEFVRVEFEGMKTKKDKLSTDLMGRKEEFFVAEKEYLEGHCTEGIKEIEEELKKFADEEKRLRTHFCDETLKTEETFKIIAHFVSRLKGAVKENTERVARMARTTAANANTCTVLLGETNIVTRRPKSRASIASIPSSIDENNLECILLQERNPRRRRSGVPPGSSALNLEEYLCEMETERRPVTVRRRATMTRSETVDDILIGSIQQEKSVEEIVIREETRTEHVSIHVELVHQVAHSSSSSSPKSSDEGFDSDQKEEVHSTVKETAKTPMNTATTCIQPTKMAQLSTSPSKIRRATTISRTSPPIQKDTIKVKERVSLLPPRTPPTTRTINTKTPSSSKGPSPPSIRRPITNPSSSPSQIPKRESKPPSPPSKIRPPPLISRTPQPPRARIPAAPRRSVPLTADEKRQSMSAPSGVSTASRPSLIKTGSATGSKLFPRMDSTEKPKALRQTTARPKWV